jgi:hypothetical protein
MAEDKTIHLTQEQLNEIDRNARAYGFEIGRGHPFVETLNELSDDNPFLDVNWRSTVEQVASDEDPVQHKNIFEHPVDTDDIGHPVRR